jgi:excisionase family DNA binding protein
MPAKIPKKRRSRATLTRTSEVLDVRMAAELLTVSPDTVYDLFKRGELPGRKVGRKWLTTRNAVLRWIEISSENNSLAKAIECGDRHVITTALKSGKVHELVIGLFINRFEFGLVV